MEIFELKDAILSRQKGEEGVSYDLTFSSKNEPGNRILRFDEEMFLHLRLSFEQAHGKKVQK